jgi:single-stranded-DNA-specific exonuclease
MTSRWSFATPDPALVDALRAEAKVSPIVARLLALRGVTAATAANYLSPSLDHLHSPYLMRGMSAAVERLSAAIANK